LFPFSHDYSKAGPYTINVTGTTYYNASISQSVYTEALLLQRSIPSDSSVGVKGIYTVNVSTSSLRIPKASSNPFIVSGILSYITNGSGVKKQPITIKLLDITNMSSPYYTPLHIRTIDNGSFSYKYSSLNSLSPGDYKVLVSTQFPAIPGLNATRNLIVEADPFTADQLYKGIAIIIGALALMTSYLKIPNYFNSRKQVNNLGIYMKDINEKYNEFNYDVNGTYNKREYLHDLEDIRDTITYLLRRRDINENQFKMLDDKITDYQHKIRNTQ
jgi:hypothetical protein